MAKRRRKSTRKETGQPIELGASTGEELAIAQKHRRRTWWRAAVVLGAVTLAGGIAGSLWWRTPPAPVNPPGAPVVAAAGSDAGATLSSSPTRPLPSATMVKRLVTVPIAPPMRPAPEFRTTGRPSQAVDPTQLAKDIAADKTGAVQLCFEHELKRNPHLQGHVVVALDLKAPRTVKHVTVKDNLHRATFTRCVKGALRSVFFPDLHEDLSIEIPFVLKSPIL